MPQSPLIESDLPAIDPSLAYEPSEPADELPVARAHSSAAGDSGPRTPDPPSSTGWTVTLSNRPSLQNYLEGTGLLKLPMWIVGDSDCMRRALRAPVAVPSGIDDESVIYLFGAVLGCQYPHLHFTAAHAGYHATINLQNVLSLISQWDIGEPCFAVLYTLCARYTKPQDWGECVYTLFLAHEDMNCAHSAVFSDEDLDAMVEADGATTVALQDVQRGIVDAEAFDRVEREWMLQGRVVAYLPNGSALMQRVVRRVRRKWMAAVVVLGEGYWKEMRAARRLERELKELRSGGGRDGEGPESGGEEGCVTSLRGARETKRRRVDATGGRSGRERV